MLDFEMFQTSKKAHLSDGCYKKEVKQIYEKGFLIQTPNNRLAQFLLKQVWALELQLRQKGQLCSALLQIASLSDVSEQELISS